ncbi:hypothetical protein [Mesonia maritima]|uniref:Uncharacterized protein n=1 Tax=Mesonia maritima TaxID=1793873 RepID=A0ABU1KA77_9FLAO|nr:hypothetical protein [Mesonia maritima]MDR6302155.1 hypothetical protein [Mesonia maritima]
MKRISILLFSFFIFSYGMAQNEDTVKETVTKKTTVKSSKGEDVSVEQKTRVRKEELNVENNNKTNQNVTRKAQISESTTFMVDENEYAIQPDKNGYVMSKMVNGKKQLHGKIRKMPDRDFYILTSKQNGDSFGYFDEDGNFIVETYDSKTDAVVLKKYKVEK